MAKEFKGWPEDWPKFKQPCFGSWESACDMLVGPCACGASHDPGEFEFKHGVLYRYGSVVGGTKLGLLVVSGEANKLPVLIEEWILIVCQSLGVPARIFRGKNG